MDSFHFKFIFSLSPSAEFLCSILERAADIPAGCCITHKIIA